MEDQKTIIHKLFICTHLIRKEYDDFPILGNLTESEAKIIYKLGMGIDNLSDIIKYFKLHKSTIRQKTRSLEEKKLIKIIVDKDDMRQRKIKLTKKGEKIYQTILDFEEEIYQRIFKDFKKNEIKELKTLVEKINVNYNDEYDIC